MAKRSVPVLYLQPASPRVVTDSLADLKQAPPPLLSLCCTVLSGRDPQMLVLQSPGAPGARRQPTHQNTTMQRQRSVAPWLRAQRPPTLSLRR